jgi:hypothetical protein
LCQQSAETLVAALAGALAAGTSTFGRLVRRQRRRRRRRLSGTTGPGRHKRGKRLEEGAHLMSEAIRRHQTPSDAISSVIRSAPARAIKGHQERTGS